MMRKVVVGIVVGVMLVGSGVALASIPDGNGVIHGCYRTSSGHDLRVIDSPSESCTSNEVALNWNQEGPQGATGSPGLSGVETIVAEASLLGGQNPETIVDIVAQCPTGKVAVAGGFDRMSVYNDIVSSHPSSDGAGWLTTVRSTETAVVSHTSRAYAVCAFVQ